MATNPYLIAGSLPWGQGGGGMFDYMSSTNPSKALAAHYQQAYNSALAMNQANYQNILQGYQQAALGQMGGQQAINKGYKTLLADVMDRINGVGKSQRQDITDQYAAAQGAALQNLVGSGLGNSTVTSSVGRGLTLDEAKATNALAEQLAQMQAGYMSNLGQARLSRQAQALNERTGLAQNQLNWMNSVQAQYPDASTYAQLAQGVGAAQQAKDDYSNMLGLIRSAQTGFGTYGMGTQSGLYSSGAAQYMAGQLAQGGAFNGGGGGGPSPFVGGRPGGVSMGNYISAPVRGGYGPYGVGGSGMSGGPGDVYAQAGRAGGPSYAGGGTGYGGGGPGMGGGFANPGGAFPGYAGPTPASSPYSGLSYIASGSPYGGGSGFGGGFGGSGSGLSGIIGDVAGSIAGLGGLWGG